MSFSKRFVDQKHSKQLIPDFVKRQHGAPLWWLVVGYICVCLLMFIIFNFTVPQYSMFLGGMLTLMLGVMVTFSAFYIHRNRDVIMAVEFQNALFAGAARNNTEFCMILRRDGTVVYADSNYHQKFSQLTKQGFYGIDALLAHQGLTEQDRELLLHAISAGDETEFPFIYTAKDGQVRQLTLAIEPLMFNSPTVPTKEIKLRLIPSSRPDGYIFLRAISSHEEQVNDHDILYHLNIPWCVLNGIGQVVDGNEAFAKLAGIVSEEIQRQPIALSTISNYVEQHDGDSNKPIEFLHAKGQPCLIRSMHWKSTHKTRKSLVFIPSASAAQTKEISSPQAVIQSVIDHAPIAIVVLDQHGAILQKNLASHQLAATIEAPFDHIDNVIGEGQGLVKDALSRLVIDPNTEQSRINVGLSHHPELSHCLVLCKLPKTDQAIPIAGYFIDTTEQRNLEERFAHSQKMQAVGQLAGGIAHDFNNLLTAMIGFCDLLLLRHPAGDPSFADIMQIKQNSSRAAGLVRQLLAFSRKQTLQPEVMDVTDILAELANLVRRLIGENIEFHMEHGRDLGMIKVDLSQLEQVVINLAVNARDAMPNGGALTMRTSHKQITDPTKDIDPGLIPPNDGEAIEPGHYIMLEVEDTGHGIPHHIIRKIFEPFFSTKEVGSGTGLGLATVYGVIKQTGGYIFVSSEEGKGTKFTILFKSYQGEEAAGVAAIVEPPAKQTIDLTGKGTILLVEDEAPVRIFSAQALTNKGYTILEADCGERGLELVEEHGPRIEAIITDVVMPGMNGPTMVTEVLKRYPNMKIIYMSGYAEDAFLKSHGTERSFNFLPKPFTLKQLALKLKEVMEEDLES